MRQEPTRALVFLSRKEYRAWAEAQPRGRTEWVAGEVVAIAPERVGHLRTKAAVWLAFRQAIVAAGLPCEVLADGVTVEVGDDTDYDPDAVVNCGERIADDAVAAPNPIVVVEVLSLSTQSVDTGAKFADYFRVPSIHHCLIVRVNGRSVIHHRRRDDGGQILAGGQIRLDLPGISVAVEDFYTDKAAVYSNNA